MDNFSNDYSSQRAFIKEPMSETANDYSVHHSLARSLMSNKLISFCIILSLIVFFGVIIGEKNKIFSRFIPKLRGEIALPDNYVVTSIDQKFPILIKKNDPRVADQLRYRGTVKSVFDDAALNLCMRGEKVVEVGAHYGYNSILLGQILKMGGKYVAIEGNPNVAKCLYKNIVLNDLSNTVEIIRTAASDHKGTCSIEDVVSAIQDDQGANSVITRKITVECNSLNEILKDEQQVSLILIDLPSSVFAILRGADRIIDESDNIRLLVSLDMNKIGKTVDIRSELTFLRQRGLKFYEVTSANEIKEIFLDEIINKEKLVLLMKKEN